MVKRCLFALSIFLLAVAVFVHKSNVKEDCELKALKEKMKTYGRIDAFCGFSKSFSDRKFSSGDDFVNSNALYLSEVSDRLDAILSRYVTLSKAMHEIADAVEKQNVFYQKYNSGDFANNDVVEMCHELKKIAGKVGNIKRKACEIISCYDRIIFARTKQMETLLLNKKTTTDSKGTVGVDGKIAKQTINKVN